jgi:hypothetical protein
MKYEYDADWLIIDWTYLLSELERQVFEISLAA